jgi:RimJ/RimL family protein N-acetyltransferase
MSPTTFFETPRLRARPFHQQDLEAFLAYRAHPDVERYQSWSDYTLEQGRALIQSMQDLDVGVPGKWYQFALEHRADGTLVGDLALCVRESEPREAEVGFSLAPAEQGKGYATEAVRALLGYAFESLRLHRVVAITDALNEPAARLLQRVGMRCEGHFEENIFFKGAWGSEFLFAVLEREWLAQSPRARSQDGARPLPERPGD